VKIRNIFKMRKLFIMLLLSYFLIFLVSVSISFGIYFESGKIIEQEISRANLSMLDQARQAMDSRMGDIERLTMQIAFNSRIINALRVSGHFRPEDQFNLYKAIEDLRHYKVSSSFITDLYVYLHDTGTVITSNTHIEGRLFFNFTYGGGDIRYEEWKNIMLTTHRQNYLVFQGKGKSENPRSFIVLAQSIPLDSIRNPRGTIVISINESKFRDVIGDIDWDNHGTVFIINEKNEIFAASEKNKALHFLESFNYQSFGNISDNNRIMYHMLNGEKMVVTYSSSKIADWKYVSIIPYNIFWGKAGYISFLTWIGVLLTILIGVVGSYFLARRNYSPIDKIIKNLTVKSNKQFFTDSNEYQFIQENITNMIDENDKIRRKIDEQNKSLKNNFLLKLIKGKLDDKTSDKWFFSTHGINFHTNNFAIILISIQNNLVSSVDDDIIELSNFRQTEFIVTSVVEELINRKNRSIIVEEEEGMITCIVNFKEDDAELNQVHMLNAIREAKEFINCNFGIAFTAVLSNIHQGSQGISQAYQEALEAMEYRVIQGKEEIICFSEIKKSKCSDYHYSIDTEQKFINCIKTGDFEKTTAFLMEILANNLSERAFSAEMSKCLMFDLVSTIIKTAEDLSDASFLEELQPIKSLSACKTVMEMKFKLADILKKVCTYYELNKTSKIFILCEKVKEYIAHNYLDLNLGVTMIGDKFDLTPSYISKLFKEQTLESLPDYINKIRIHKAMQLLKQESATVFDVAQKVGYCNSNVFIRAFKKYQGITPGRFKEMKESS